MLSRGFSRRTQEIKQKQVGLVAEIWAYIRHENPVKKTETNDREDPLRWPRNTLYPQKLALLRQQAAVARSA
jgi:hypothetical protein